MIFEPRRFYQTYQSSYHEVKVRYLKNHLDSLSGEQKSFLGQPLDENERKATIRIIKSDLRQTYFHAIETFFELFFASRPIDDIKPDPDNILFRMSDSKGSKTYGEIRKIADNPEYLDFMDKTIEFSGKKYTIGRYLFYPGIIESNFPQYVLEDINQSIEAIKYGIAIIASDFINREEYNAYKHGLRLIPSVNALMLADAKKLKEHNEIDVKLKWDLTDSMSYYQKTKNSNELKIVTKLLDSERDIKMTTFCSNLIDQLIFLRRITYNFDSDSKKFDKIPIFSYGKMEVDECSRINVPVQDLVYTVKTAQKPE